MLQQVLKDEVKSNDADEGIKKTKWQICVGGGRQEVSEGKPTLLCLEDCKTKQSGKKMWRKEDVVGREKGSEDCCSREGRT
jgi:hypothetical protein